MTPEVKAAAERLNAAVAATKATLTERDELVDLAALSLVAGQHMFLAGPPGTAKSMAVMELFRHIGGSQGYYNLTKGSTPEALVGAMSVKALKEEDVFRHNVAGMLPDVHFAYITEVFKGNALTRNSILQVLNERQFFNGGHVVECPLVFCAADSNEYPDSREDAAFYDRFLVRYQVGPISSHAAKMQMIRDSVARPTTRSQETIAELEDILLLNEARREIALPSSLDDVDQTLAANLSGVKAPGGDRRWQRTYMLAQAKALLEGRDAVEPKDLILFSHTMWSEPEDRKAVQHAVLRAISPEVADITQYYDEVEAAFEEMAREMAKAEERKDTMAKMAAAKRFGDAAEGQLGEIAKIVNKLRIEGKDSDDATQMFQKASLRLKEANQMVFGKRPELTI